MEAPDDVASLPNCDNTLAVNVMESFQILMKKQYSA